MTAYEEGEYFPSELGACVRVCVCACVCVCVYIVYQPLQGSRSAVLDHTNCVGCEDNNGFLGDLRSLGRFCELLEKASEIGASKIKAPIGSFFQKYVSSSFMVKMRIDLGSFGLFWFILGWG